MGAGNDTLTLAADSSINYVFGDGLSAAQKRQTTVIDMGPGNDTLTLAADSSINYVFGDGLSAAQKRQTTVIDMGPGDDKVKMGGRGNLPLGTIDGGGHDIGDSIDIRALLVRSSELGSFNYRWIHFENVIGLRPEPGFIITKHTTAARTLDEAGEQGVVTSTGKIQLQAGDANPGVLMSNLKTRLDVAGEISTEQANQAAVKVINGPKGNRGKGATVILKKGGLFKTAGNQAAGVYSSRDDFTLTMQDGTISTAGSGASGVYSTGERFTFEMSGGEITTSGDNSHGLSLLLAGNKSVGKDARKRRQVVSDKDADRNYEHLIEIDADTSISTSGTAAHGIVIDDNLDTSRARLVIAGSITVEGQNAVGILIKDTAGGVSEFEISGTIEAKKKATTAIQNTGNLPLTINISGQARITGAVIMGTGNDTITLTDSAHITGDIIMGEGNDTLTLNGTAQITGKITMGAGNDTLTLAADSSINYVFGDGLSAAQKRQTTVIDMGPGDDKVKLGGRGNLPFGTIDGGGHDTGDSIDIRALLVRSSELGSFNYRWIHFENVIGLRPEPGFIIIKHTTAARTLDEVSEQGVVTSTGKIQLQAGDANPGVLMSNLKTRLEVAGEISTQQKNQAAVKVINGRMSSRGKGATAILKSGGSFRTSGNFAHAVYSERDDFTLTMQDGTISTAGSGASGVYSTGERFTFEMSGGEITTSGDNSHGLSLLLAGNKSVGKDARKRRQVVSDKDADRNYEHLIEIDADTSISTSGTAAHGIVIDDNLDTSRARLVIAGSITVEGQNAVGILIKDTAGGVSEFEISGTIEAKKQATTAIQNTGNLPLTINISDQARITGAVIMGTGNDTITLTDSAHITGDIIMGEGNDTLTLNGTAQITGKITMGAGNDTLTLAADSSINYVFGDGLSAAQKRQTTVIDMGPGDDKVKLGGRGNLPFGTIDGGGHDTGDSIDIRALLVRSSELASFNYRWIHFENVIGLRPEPGFIITKHTTAARTLDEVGEQGVVTSTGKIQLQAGDANPGVLMSNLKTRLDVAGEISTQQANQAAVKVINGRMSSRGKGATVILKKGGLFKTAGNQAAGVRSSRDDFTLTMQGGTITTAGNAAHGVHSMGERFTFNMTGGEITTSGDKSHGVYLLLTGNKPAGKDARKRRQVVSDKDADRNYEHLIEIDADTSISTSGNAAHGIVIDDNVDTSRARLVIAGSITVEGENAVGILIKDTAGGVSEFEISGTIEAKKKATTAIQNTGNLPLTINISGQARITGAVIMGTGNDTITLTDSAQITGNITMGAGNDTLTLNDSAQIIGKITMGAGNDTLTLAADSSINYVFGDGLSAAQKRQTTVIDMGPGDDKVKLGGRGNLPFGTIDGGGHDIGDSIDIRALLVRSSELASFNYRWIHFEDVIGLVNNLGRQAPGGGEGDNRGRQALGGGAGNNRGRRAAVQAITVAVRRRGGNQGAGQGGQSLSLPAYLIGINLPTESSYDPSRSSGLILVDPTGQAAEARVLIGLTDALHDLTRRRLDGGGSQWRASRPIRLASSERIPGLLFRDSRPSVWAEAFTAAQRRAKDGYAKAYALNYKGIAAGVEQDFRRARLGFLFGYARTMFRTQPASIKTESDSFFAGLYGRRTFDDIYYLQGALNFNYSDHENLRQVGGLGTAKGKYSSWAVSSSLTLGRDFRLNSRFNLEPSVNLRYSAGFYDEYRDKGTLREGLFFKSRTQQSLLGRLNLAGVYQLPDEAGRVALSLGVSHRRHFTSRLKGHVSDQAFDFKSAGSNKVTLGYVGVDIAVNVTEGLSVNGRWEYATNINGVSDRANRAQLSLLWRF